MTYLIAGAVVLLLGIAGQMLSIATELTVLRARAQAAADAAALSAAWESVPGAAAQPHEQAAAFARANGAEVVECLCDPGATAMQVTVRLGDAEARARAVFDPELLRPALPPH